jgi:hypothetical protein
MKQRMPTRKQINDAFGIGKPVALYADMNPRDVCVDALLRM